MNVLVLDSCGSSCGAGVYEGGRVLAQAYENMERGQDARLMAMVLDVLKRAKKDFEDIDRIAATRGPGSFTGTRVCLAAARGIGFAAAKPVLGIDRFSVYRALHADVKNLLVVIDSKRAELFCKYYSSKGAAQEASMMTEEQIQKFIGEHPGTEIAGDKATPSDDILSACAEIAVKADASSAEFAPRPLYIRAPDVTFAAERCENHAQKEN